MGRRQAGQGMTEYVIVVALIAVAAIAIVQVFGQQLRENFYTMAKALAGQSTQTNDKAAKASGETGKASLADYGVLGRKGDGAGSR
jgi:type IV pilus assembly protein PilA